MHSLINLVERGFIPDPLLRFGIRRLLKQRLTHEDAGDCESQLNQRQNFLRDLRSSPIAIHTHNANEQHYEVPAAFFETVLGPHLKYSSGYWPSGAGDLRDSEEAMLDLTAQRAEIEDGMAILDLGCGWGSLSMWIARKCPQSQVLAVSNSLSQAEFIRGRCRDRGISNLEVVTEDMNRFDPQRKFDRVLSVEMFEHMRNWPELFFRISNWLKADGKMFMHVFCHREHVYPYLSAGPSDWMAEHFFTGGMMPSDDLPYMFADHLLVSDHWRINGFHYSKTLEAWLCEMDQKKHELMPLFEEVYGEHAKRWFERWRIFFLACSELFAFREGNEWWVSHYLLEPKATRKEISDAHFPVAVGE